MRTGIRSSPALAPLPPLAASALLLGSLGASGAAHAADGDHIIIGLGAANLPGYKGSDRRITNAVPLVDVQKGRFFAKSNAGLGLNLYQNSHVAIGAGINWMKGYRAEDAPAGFGGVKDALGGRVFVATRLGDAIVTFSFTQALTEKERGLQMDTQVAHPWRATERLTLAPSLAVSAGNAKYMNSYFGVDGARSARSGLSQYSLKGGVKEVTLGIRASYKLTGRWAIVGGVAAGQLLGDAADSPIVKRKSDTTGILGLTYAF